MEGEIAQCYQTSSIPILLEGGISANWKFLRYVKGRGKKTWYFFLFSKLEYHLLFIYFEQVVEKNIMPKNED